MRRLISIIFLFAVSFYTSAQALQPQTLYSSDFIIDEIPRNFNFYIPLHYSGGDSHALILFLSDNSTAKNSIEAYGDIMHANADSNNTVVVYPDAVRHWNNGLSKDTINDAGFLSILIDYFVQRYQCNPLQVYVCGLGNGGAMAYKLQCDYPTKVTAVAAFFSNQNKNLCSNAGTFFMNTQQNPSTANTRFDAVIIKNMYGFFMQKERE